jgi:hypothetical protein
VVVADIKPPRLPVLVGVIELVWQVLADDVFAHLNPGASDNSRVISAWLQLYSEELPKQDPLGFDPQKSFAEMYKDGGVEDPIGVEVLDAIVPKHPLEEVAGR